MPLLREISSKVLRQVLELSEEDETLFAPFQLWVDESDWKPLVDLYIFGDKYGIPDLQDMVIDLLIDKRTASRTIPISIFNHVYRNTQTNSSLREVCVDWSVHDIKPRLWFEGKKNRLLP